MGKKLTKPKKTTSQPKMILSNCEAIIPPKGCKSFPSDVLKWMKANAKPLMALKLMQVCKYFQHKRFPFELIKGLSKKEGGSWNYSTTGNAFCAASTIDNIHHKKFLFITQYLYLYQRIDPFSSFLSKVAVYQAKSLHFDFQNITFNEFKILTSAGTIETAKIRNTKITDENDENKLAAFEKILECLPKVKELYFGEIVPSFVSWRWAAEVDVPKLRYLELQNIDVDFNHALFTWFKKPTQIIEFSTTGSPDIAISGEFWFYKILPTWFNLLQYYPTTASLNIIRILLDSFIVLTVLNGYFSCVTGF